MVHILRLYYKTSKPHLNDHDYNKRISKLKTSLAVGEMFKKNITWKVKIPPFLQNSSLFTGCSRKQKIVIRNLKNGLKYIVLAFCAAGAH